MFVLHVLRHRLISFLCRTAVTNSSSLTSSPRRLWRLIRSPFSPTRADWTVCGECISGSIAHRKGAMIPASGGAATTNTKSPNSELPSSNLDQFFVSPLGGAKKRLGASDLTRGLHGHSCLRVRVGTLELANRDKSSANLHIFVAPYARGHRIKVPLTGCSLKTYLCVLWINPLEPSACSTMTRRC